MPTIRIQEVHSNVYKVPKARLMEMFLTPNGLSAANLKNFYYDTNEDALVFELAETVTTPVVNYSSANLTGP